MSYWSPQEDTLLRVHWRLPSKEISALLNGRSASSVRHRKAILSRTVTTPKPTPIQCSDMDIRAGVAVFRAGVE